ncbi:hypothetical protein [Streptomyces adonidis]|uniref:Uncharacterized protein n=1 Tax=Streptomyces sp. NBC_00093 TaxID=2975649 RepID=A0AAU2AGE7_9ACTN
MTDVQQAPALALLGDGTTVRIEWASHPGHDAVPRMYEELSPQNPWPRFHTVGRTSARRTAGRVPRAARPGHRAPLPFDHGGPRAADVEALGQLSHRSYGVQALDGRVRLLPSHPDDPCPRRLRCDRVPVVPEEEQS